MFQIGDKVIMDADTKNSVEGYIVAITIDPITESEVEFEKKDWLGIKCECIEIFMNMDIQIFIEMHGI